MWQTYTPDGLTLTLRRGAEGWLATYLERRVEGASPEEAIRGALGVESPAGDAELESWIAKHVAALDAEAAAGD